MSDPKKVKKEVKAWAIAGDWDKGVFWWYDAEDLNQFQIYRTKKHAMRAVESWHRNGYPSARVVRCGIEVER